MELKKYGWHCRYVQEYLAIGEAPEQIRNCYQQRSRWCKVGPAFLKFSECSLWLAGRSLMSMACSLLSSQAQRDALAAAQSSDHLSSHLL